MADITMCNDKSCPHASKCYRFTANANPYRQSYFMESPLDKNNDWECLEFLPNKIEQALKEKNER